MSLIEIHIVYLLKLCGQGFILSILSGIDIIKHNLTEDYSKNHKFKVYRFVFLDTEDNMWKIIFFIDLLFGQSPPYA